MIKLLHKPIIIAALLCFSFNTFGKTVSDRAAQQPVKADTVKEKSSFKIGVDYLSDNVFMGRTGPTATPTIAPETKFTFKSGIYISGTVDYVPSNKKQKLDGGDLGAGYDFDITDDLSGGVAYTKLFNNANSKRIGSAISSTVSAFFDYDIAGIITPSIGGDYDLNKQGISNDAFFNVGLSHDFIIDNVFTDEDFIFISPTVTGNAGTQNFYDAYLNTKVLKSAKKTAAQDALIAQFKQNTSQFKMLDYEFSAPIEYKAGHFILQFSPSYAIVQNEFKPAAAKALGLSDKPSIFYFTTGAAFKF